MADTAAVDSEGGHLSVPASAAAGDDENRRAEGTQELEPQVGYRRLLLIGLVAAAAVTLLDTGVYLFGSSQMHGVLALLAAGSLLSIGYALYCLRKGREDRAVAVPLVYVMLVAPVGPLFTDSRMLIAMVLPFIAMAVAVNFASARYVPYYAAGAWATTMVVFAMWQWQVGMGFTQHPLLTLVTMSTTGAIVALAFYAFSRYSVRLERAFQSLRSANEGLMEAHESLKAVNQARIAFINTAAHELNTPLTPIRIQMELLNRAVAKGDQEGAKRSAMVMDRNFHRLGRMVSDLLDGARLDAGQLKMVFDETDLSALVEDALQEYQGPAGNAGVTLRDHVESGVRVEGDPIRLRQVVDNLLTNALKFTPKDGRIDVRLERRPKEVRLEVRDSGLGMERTLLRELFQPFRQVHENLSVEKGGAGLGLYITRGIVERHGGRVWAESDGLGTGTAFIVALPLLDPEADACALDVRPLPVLAPVTNGASRVF
jgi:signal transduction histidine kinase